MPRVSIIVAAYNCSDSIAETITSVRQQTYSDWEIIVCDDCSTDKTFTTLQKLSDRQSITNIQNSRNLGPALTRNHALEHAQGELIVFLDSDDILLPEYLTQMVARYDRLPQETGIVACDAYIEQNGERVPYTYKEQFRSVQPLTLERVLQRNCIYISSLVPRRIGEQLNWFSGELFGTEDFDLWVRILELGKKAVFIDEPLAVYRKKEGSISSNITRMAVNNQRMYQNALKRKQLTPKQRRIVYIELLYNNAMEVVSAAWFERKILPALMRLPILLIVFFTHPHHWAEWLRALRNR